MSTSIEEPLDVAGVNEASWRAWILKGKVQEKETNRRLKLVAGLAIGLFAVAGIYIAFAR